MILDGFQEIMDCKTPLEVLALRISAWDLEPALKKILSFSNLESFEASWGGNYNSIPKEILKLPKLKRLSFTKNQLSKIPEELVYAENLEYLDLSSNHINVIPSFLNMLKKLKELNLSANFIAEVDEEAFIGLKDLYSLNLSSAKFDALPDALLKLVPQLSELWLDKKTAGELKRKHSELYNNIPYIAQNKSAESKLLKKLQQQFQKEQLSSEMRALLLNLSGNNKEKIVAQASPEMILQACNFKSVEPIRLRALEYLGEQFSEAGKEALKKDAKLAVFGKLGINKNELRQKLKDHNIKYAAKIDATTTHVLFGQMPGTEAALAFEKGLYILNEKNIIDFWEAAEKPYMLEVANESPEQLESLSAMLLSAQEDSIAVALSMFKQGGFPKELLTELFIAYKTLTANTPASREAERLLRQYGSAELIGKIKSAWSIFIYDCGEVATTRAINDLCKNTELDGLKFAKYVRRRFSGATNYLLKHLPEKEALAFLRELVDDKGTLNLSGMGLQSVPSSLFGLGSSLKKLLLCNNNIRKIPEQLKKLTDLKELDLRYNNMLTKDVNLRASLAACLPSCKVFL